MADDTQKDERLERAMAGDEVALADVFEQYRGRLRRMVALRMDARVQRRIDASDVLQDAFIDVAQQLRNYVKEPKLPFFFGFVC